MISGKGMRAMSINDKSLASFHFNSCTKFNQSVMIYLALKIPPSGREYSRALQHISGDIMSCSGREGISPLSVGFLYCSY